MSKKHFLGLDFGAQRVIAVPAEATGTGNLLIQAMAQGYLENLQHIRQVVRNSFDLITYEPEDQDIWDSAYIKFQKIAKQN